MEYYGVDLSHWNGTVDFTKFDKSFVIAKLSQAQYKDPNFETYYSSCKVPFGAYIYNKVKNVAEAQKEAQFAVEQLKGRKLALGVWLDLEDASMQKLGKNVLTAIIEAEAGILRNAGYSVGIYCNRSWYLNVLDSANLSNDFPFWIARYPSADNGTVKQSLNPSTLKGCVMWQYSSKGKVNGIAGNTDLDVAFVNPVSFFSLYDKVDASALPSTSTKPTLKMGSRNDYVKAWQEYLNTLGFNLVVDGQFGINTKNAVIEFQKKAFPNEPKEWDGVIGNKTWAMVGKI